MVRSSYTDLLEVMCPVNSGLAANMAHDCGTGVRCTVWNGAYFSTKYGLENAKAMVDRCKASDSINKWAGYLSD